MREQIEKRPALALFAGLICGLCAFVCPASVILLIGFCVFARPTLFRLLAGAAFAVGLWLAPTAMPLILEPIPVHGIATVASVPKVLRDGERCTISFKGRQIWLIVSSSQRLVLGDEIWISGIERPIPAAAEQVANVVGIEGMLDLDRVQVIRHGTWVARLADSWRGSFTNLIGRNLGEEQAGLIDAMCFNEDGLLPGQNLDDLMQSGLIHIITASGLQVFILIFLAGGLFRVFPPPRIVQVILLTAILAVYALASGLNPAIVRAVFMALAGLGCYYLDREPDSLSAMALVGFGYLIWAPFAVFNVGFQMSYIVVAAVCLFLRREPSESKEKYFVYLTKEYVKVMAVILTAAVPLTVYYFGSFSVFSVIAYLLVCLSLPLLVLISFLSYVVNSLLPAVADEILQHFVAPLADWVLGVAHWFAQHPGAVQFPVFSGFWLIAFYCAWVMTYRRRVVQA